MSYYQKYRPAKIAELDLDKVRESLLASLKSDSLPHAYLFVGPRGAGKTSAARIMAAAVNCEKNAKKLAEPCGDCDVCQEIRQGQAVDVMEMDAASHRGIDDIRSLREKIRLAPTRLRKKVYIIDEVHMLTKEAFNALLKVLEEPPEHVMFFLCTTEEHKVPETIASRCTRVVFQKASVKEVLRSLDKVVKGEKIDIDKKAVEFLAESVDGSFREGHKLLEQLVSNFKKIGVDEVKQLLGITGKKRVGELLDYVAEGGSKEIGEVMREIEEEGVDAANLLKDLLVESRQRLRSDNERVWIEVAEVLIRAAENLRFSPLPLLPIEVALIEVSLGRNGEEEEGGGGGKREVEKKEKPTKQRKEQAGKKKATKKEEEIDEVVKDCLIKTSFSQIEKEWGELLKSLAPKYQSIAGLLRSARPKEVEGKYLTVEVFYKFHKDQLEQESKRKVIEEVANKLWGPVALRCVLGERQVVEKKVEEVVDEGSKVEEEIVKAAEDIFA